MDDYASRWLAQHPFLEKLASFHDVIASALARAGLKLAPAPPLDAWNLQDGVPLLRSGSVQLVRAPELGLSVLGLCVALAGAPVPEKMRQSVLALQKALSEPNARAGFVLWLVHGGESRGAWDEGAARFLGWTALTYALDPTRRAVSDQLLEARWSSGVCPTCGSEPAMALLAPESEGAHRRLLACGPCGTRFPYRRVGCPHCGNEDASRLRVLEISGEPSLRLDVCEDCKGYVKTCTQGEGSAFLLKDWPTVHLDVMASEEGYLRHGASLYDLGPDA